MRLIDTHAHIYLPEFDTDRTDMIHDAAGKGVGTILLPAIDSSTHQHMLALEKQFNMCVPMMGLHPCSVKENFWMNCAL
jgi:TatD DNase family protein